jgi:hypothetical protein
MPVRKNGYSSTSKSGVNSRRWAKLSITGVIIFVVPFLIPDFVPDVMSKLLSRDISQFTGLESFLKALIFIWLVSSVGLIVAGIVDWFLNRRRS